MKNKHSEDSTFYFERAIDKDELGDLEGAIEDYTKAIEVDDPFLLQKIEFLLKEWGIGTEIKNLYYGYIKKNFKEKWDSIIDAAKDNEDKKWELTFDIWDKKTDELGLHHWYLWEINEIYDNDSYNIDIQLLD